MSMIIGPEVPQKIKREYLLDSMAWMGAELSSLIVEAHPNSKWEGLPPRNAYEILQKEAITKLLFDLHCRIYEKCKFNFDSQINDD